MTPEHPSQQQSGGWRSSIGRLFRSATVIEADEGKAVALAMACFFLLFGSYSVIKPVRDAMGTIYGMSHIQELFTGTFLASIVLAPLYSWLASRIRLTRFLPGVYAVVASSIRFIRRFGATAGLMLNPIVMVIAFTRNALYDR